MYTDFHAHILPGMDHGSTSTETTRNQLSAAKELGISTIVATSHFYPDIHRVGRYLEKRELSLKRLQDSVEDPPHIIPGAEVTLTYELPSLPDLEKLCISDTDYILIEVPEYTQTKWIFDALYKISSVRKLRPIIAHIDRYEESIAEELMDMGYAVQINAEALMSIRNRNKWIRKIVQKRIDLLGSDVHSDAKEYKYFSRSLKILKDHIPTLMQNADRILQNRPL
ncbi:MAG: CpsB/CapC family capsule biosynthesis tyrosine phosphatase [Eubacteriales bacterium]|jgi:protein-tyrosine phosphatase